ncbi:MAG: tRNA (guanosine(37)-N1)-methyltransferase TrmD [Halobacteriovoraceae bacterium]|nr:tRNA (guanosine(37)-N1)-methyltransferase TrmD [Halobacteriovoraceae bacterium]
MNKIWVITLFPEYFNPFKENGVVGQTLSGNRGKKIELNTVQLSDYSPKKFKGVDDSPYGGGAGMVIRADVLKDALFDGVIKPGNYNDYKKELHIVYPAPRGYTWCHEQAVEFAEKHFTENSPDLVFICGRYEGIDERFLINYVDEYISVGNFILTGGELAVMTILDSSLRFAPGVLGNKLSSKDESFSRHGLEYPLYTRPSEFEGLGVPSILTSGNHLKIAEFKEKSAIKMTEKYRPDLLEK